MKITIFGATGGTGGYLVRLALAAGHEVTAVARDPARIAPAGHDHLRVLRGDVFDAASLMEAVSGQDAVVSCLGATGHEKPVTLYSVGTGNILNAMQTSDTQRFLCISANPLEIGNGDMLLDRLVLKPVVRAIFKETYADVARMETEVRDSGLDWTIVRPPRLTNRPPTDHYRIAYDHNLPRGRFISRADLAGAMLHLLDDPKAGHTWVTVAY